MASSFINLEQMVCILVGYAWSIEHELVMRMTETHPIRPKCFYRQTRVLDSKTDLIRKSNLNSRQNLIPVNLIINDLPMLIPSESQYDFIFVMSSWLVMILFLFPSLAIVPFFLLLLLPSSWDGPLRCAFWSPSARIFNCPDLRATLWTICNRSHYSTPSLTSMHASSPLIIAEVLYA